MSSTIIDALIVTLGLDPAQFKKGSADAKKELKGLGDEGRRQAVEETKRAKEREKQAKTAAEGIHKIKLQVLGMAAALVSASGLIAFTARITKSDAAVGRLSNNLGMATDELSAWKGAADKVGSSGADVEAMFRNINGIVQEVRLTGGSAAMAPLARAGVDIAKFLDKSTTMAQRASMIADAMKRLSPQDAQSFGAMAGFGEGDINLLMHGSNAIDDLVEAQRKANIVSKADAEAAQKRAAAWQRLTDSLEHIGRVIETRVTPALVKLLEIITANMPAAVVLAGGLSVALTAFSAVRFAGLLSGIGGVSAALAGATGAAAALLGQLGIIAAGSAAVYSIATALGADKLGEWIGGKIYDLVHPDDSASNRSQSGSVTGSWRSGAASSGSRLTRGMRNNNPGNLNFAGQAGARREGGSGRFAAFGSMDEGVAALANQLQIYASRGNDTLRGIISKYAPAGENNTAAYIQSMVKRMGVGADQHLDLKNISVLREVIAGISTVENGAGRLGIGQINSGLAMFQSGRYGRYSGGGSSTTDVKVGQVTIHTQATDAKGIAIDFGNAVSQHAFATQANAGVR